jgi:hypothetical protein
MQAVIHPALSLASPSMEEMVERALSVDLDLVGKNGGGACVLRKEGGSTGEGAVRF